MSELVTNAVVHGAPATELTVRFSSTGSMIRVAVVNLGGVFDPQLERGYSGLRIVDRIVDRWGIEPLNDSVEVWFEVDDVPVDVDVQTSATAL
ncbi:MAG: ATP-binding protein [Acidimicrobiia bacterium]